MKHPIKIRVFRLADDGEYKLNDETIDDYIVNQLYEGYVTTDIRNLDSERLRLFLSYQPDRARAIVERGGDVELCDPPLEEV